MHSDDLLKLTIELVPKTSWFTNLRSLMTQSGWDLVRSSCYHKARHRCEVCSGKGDKHPVECHEIWDYDDYKGIQTLVRTIALCPDCHKVKHIGLQMSKGVEHFERSITHFMRVNNVDEEFAEQYIMEAFHEHKLRSQRKWTLNIDWLKERFPSAFEKVTYAQKNNSDF